MEEAYCYYSILGIPRDASVSQIRTAYRKLAMKWHPDKWTRNHPSLVAEAKKRFQQIQEAYSVLSDEVKRAMYDAGLYDTYEEEEEEDEGFAEFMQEMVGMMNNVKSQHQEGYSFEELQKMFTEITGWDNNNINSHNFQFRNDYEGDDLTATKRRRHDAAYQENTSGTRTCSPISMPFFVSGSRVS